jgi:hypothetical protein
LPHWPEGDQQEIAWWSNGYDAKAGPAPGLPSAAAGLDGRASPMPVTGANGSWTTVDFILSA